MPRAIISSGHTAANPGVIANGLQEFEVARKIAKAALKYIRINGIISLSIPPNLELDERIKWINKTGYMRATNDVAIEVHINDGGNSGLEAWHEGEGGNPSQNLANYVLEATSRESGLPNLGAKSEFKHELGSIAFVHELNPHSIILECGYIDSPSDADFLKDDKNIDTLGRGIAKGILNYYGLDYRELPQQSAPPVTNIQQMQAGPAIPQQLAGQAAAQPVYQQPAYQQPAYPQPGYPQPGYPQPGYPQQSYQQPVYQQPATYQQPAYQQPAAYQQPVAYQQPTYQQPAAYKQPAEPIAMPVTAPIPNPAPKIEEKPKTPVINAQTDDFEDDFDDYEDDWEDELLDDKPVVTKPVTAPVAATQSSPSNQLQNMATPSPVNATTGYGAYSAPTPQPTGISGFNGYNNPAAPSTAPMMSREERKDMIVKNYIRILGREPNQNDLNYFLNIGIREDELLKKMTDSQEHADLVKARQEVITMKKEFGDAQAELIQLRSVTEDQKTILDQLTQSIEQKNIALTKLQNDLNELQQKKFNQTTQTQSNDSGKSTKKYKGTFADKFFKAMSDLLE